MRRRSLILGGLVGGAILSGIFALFGVDKPPARAENEDVRIVAASASSETVSAAEYAADAAGHREIALPFLAKHCARCHGPDVQEGGFRVDQQLPNEFLSRNAAEAWSEVLHRLNRGDMPPKDEPRPAAADAARIVDWISHERLRGEKARRGTEIVLRRLNRAEYDNTIRELTGVDMRPSEAFPPDPPAAGFDNNGGALAMTPLQLELYVQAARQVLDRALVNQTERPASNRWRFQIEEGFQAGHGPAGARQQHYVTIDGRRMSVNCGCNSQRGDMTVFRQPVWNTCGFAHVGGLALPHPGEYIVRFRAAAVVPSPEEVLRVAVEMRDRITDEEEARMGDQRQRQGYRDYWERHGREEARRHFSGRHYRYGPPRLQATLQQSGLSRILGEFDVTAPVEEPAICGRGLIRTRREPPSPSTTSTTCRAIFRTS
jgi:mono/diheme cytochrome c family protein